MTKTNIASDLTNEQIRALLEKDLFTLSKEGVNIFNIDGGMITEDDSFDIATVMMVLFISPNGVKQILAYLKVLMKQYNKNIVDILKDILLELEEYEKHFALFVLGKNFKYSYENMSEDEQRKYLTDIAQLLCITDDKITNLLFYLMDSIEKETINGPSSTIKRIIISNFEDNEIDYMVLLRGFLI
jgi:hypothetical protein